MQSTYLLWKTVSKLFYYCIAQQNTQIPTDMLFTLRIKYTIIQYIVENFLFGTTTEIFISGVSSLDALSIVECGVCDR